jgi:tetratricopeptide (TPR) repeat protein
MKAEAKHNQAEECMQKANLAISKLDKDKHKEWITEVNLKKELIAGKKINPETIVKLEEFVEKYPGSFASNEFALEIGNYYQTKKSIAKAAIYFEKLINYSEINDDDFYKAKLDLAEYYYDQNDDLNALKNFRTAKSRIDLKQPSISFHYAVVLNETGNTEKAKNHLAFLINNAGYFNGFDTAVNYFCKLLRKSG